MGVKSSEINSSIKVDMNTSIDTIDKENLLSALREKNLRYCSRIRNKDRKIECFGIIKRNSGYCDMIQNKDLKNKCLSVALSDDSLCENIKNKTIKSECKVLDR
jgi:hypothetical protein